MILIIYAHPYPQHSHANSECLNKAGTLEGVEIRSLYQLYPDFNIDVAAEQAALAPCRSGYLAASYAVVIAYRRC
ncbi:glutathione-regulated potassium-efflux system ancillary protein KefF [Klebsiella variicola]|nr:glutathione-regulated potassium-efflux system ancillary protein KefF [Klebsiella variicola]